MEKMQWEDSLSVGIESIDDQHKTWFDRFNSVVEAIESGHPSSQIANTLDFLADYTEFHFSTEEKSMSANAYPGLEEHKAEHEELTRALNNLVQDFEEEGVTRPLTDSINTLLANWLVKHIKSADTQFGAFLKEKGIALTEE